jgi:prophage regulatory protein
MMPDRSKDSLVRLPEVKGRTGMSRTTIYRKMASGAFPKPIQISSAMVAWYQSDLDAWIADPMGWQAAA